MSLVRVSASLVPSTWPMVDRNVFEWLALGVSYLSVGGVAGVVCLDRGIVIVASMPLTIGLTLVSPLGVLAMWPLAMATHCLALAPVQTLILLFLGRVYP